MKKFIPIIISIAIVVSVAVGTTLAYLTSQSAKVSNTFVTKDVGSSLAIILDEALVDDATGLALTGESAQRVTENNSYPIVPGNVMDKDPTVTILDKSAACYVFVCVDNQLVLGDETISVLNINADWETVVTSGTKTLYSFKKEIIPAVDDINGTKLSPVFTKVTLDGDAITNDNIESLDGKKIEVKAYAHQAANQTYNDALIAAKAVFGFSA